MSELSFSIIVHAKAQTLTSPSHFLQAPSCTTFRLRSLCHPHHRTAYHLAVLLLSQLTRHRLLEACIAYWIRQRDLLSSSTFGHRESPRLHSKQRQLLLALDRSDGIRSRQTFHRPTSHAARKASHSHPPHLRVFVLRRHRSPHHRGRRHMGFPLHLPPRIHPYHIHDVDSQQSQRDHWLSLFTQTNLQTRLLYKTLPHPRWRSRRHLCLFRRVVHCIQPVRWRKLPIQDLDLAMVPPRWLDIHPLPRRLRGRSLDLATYRTQLAPQYV